MCIFWSSGYLHGYLRAAGSSNSPRVTEFGVSTFWCGGMGAFDMFAASAVKHLQTECPHLRLLLVLAYLPAQSAEIPDIYDGSLYP